MYNLKVSVIANSPKTNPLVSFSKVSIEKKNSEKYIVILELNKESEIKSFLEQGAFMRDNEIGAYLLCKKEDGSTTNETVTLSEISFIDDSKVYEGTVSINKPGDRLKISFKRLKELESNKTFEYTIKKDGLLKRLQD